MAESALAEEASAVSTLCLIADVEAEPDRLVTREAGEPKQRGAGGGEERLNAAPGTRATRWVSLASELITAAAASPLRAVPSRPTVLAAGVEQRSSCAGWREREPTTERRSVVRTYPPPPGPPQVPVPLRSGEAAAAATEGVIGLSGVWLRIGELSAGAPAAAALELPPPFGASPLATCAAPAIW
jgi:hypothetical protein